MKMMALALGLAVTVSGQAASVDVKLPAYKKVSGVSGTLNSVGSDTLNNMMALWAESFQALYPNVKIQIEGLTLYGANGRQDVPSSSLLLLPSGAFATSEDTFITVSSLGESIGIALNGKRFPPFDRVSLSARLERSAIALENLCGQAQKSDT